MVLLHKTRLQTSEGTRRVCGRSLTLASTCFLFLFCIECKTQQPSVSSVRENTVKAEKNLAHTYGRNSEPLSRLNYFELAFVFTNRIISTLSPRKC